MGPPGFEPGVADLQSTALAAWLRSPIYAVSLDHRERVSSLKSGHFLMFNPALIGVLGGGGGMLQVPFQRVKAGIFVRL